MKEQSIVDSVARMVGGTPGIKAMLSVIRDNKANTYLYRMSISDLDKIIIGEIKRIDRYDHKIKEE